MAMSAKVGSFALSTGGTGSQSVTGVGFQPKALLFYATDETADANSANVSAFIFLGMATSSSNRAAISSGMASGSAANSRCDDNTKCILVVNTAGTTQDAADFTSMDADGFTINITTNSNTGRIINYLALGGADLTNAFIKQYQSPAATGSQSQTGVGFKPTAMIQMMAGNSNVPPNNQTNSGMDVMLSFVTSSAQRGAVFIEGDDGVAGASEEIQKAAKSFEKSSGGGAITIEADFTSFDADGFTQNFGTESTANKYVWALCLKGGQYFASSFNENTSTGNQAITGTGFQPVAVMFASGNRATSTAVNNPARMSIGAASDSTHRGGIWSGGTENSTSIGNSLIRTKALQLITDSAGALTVNAAFDFVSNDSNGFTINNTTADATSREILYMAFGSNAATAQIYPQLATLGAGI